MTQEPPTLTRPEGKPIRMPLDPVDILQFKLSHSLPLSHPSLSPISFYLSLPPICNKIKSIQLTLAYGLICTLIWAEALLNNQIKTIGPPFHLLLYPGAFLGLHLPPKNDGSQGKIKFPFCSCLLLSTSRRLLGFLPFQGPPQPRLLSQCQQWPHALLQNEPPGQEGGLSKAGSDGQRVSWSHGFLPHLQVTVFQENFGSIQGFICMGSTSKWKPVVTGVHQGSIQGPIFINMFINNRDSGTEWTLKEL